MIRNFARTLQAQLQISLQKILGQETVSNSDHLGHIIEADVGALLASLPGKLYYWREGNFELDYVWENNDHVFAIEVKSHHKRRANSLGKFLKKYPDAIPVVITMEQLPKLHKDKQDFFLAYK